MNEPSSRLKRILVGVVGGMVLLIGIITIPYPGPGWLIVFAGLGILSSEFDWAKRLLNSLRKRYDAWQKWLSFQPLYVRAGFWLMTFVVVVVTIWLLNGYGILNDVFDLELDWVASPLFN